MSRDPGTQAGLTRPVIAWSSHTRRPHMKASGPTVHQTSYDLLCEVLKALLWEVVKSGAHHQVGSVPFRASAALYALLMNHPVDRKGRCRSCRRPGALFGRQRRRCRIYRSAHFYLRQPREFLLSHLAAEMEFRIPSSPGPHAGTDRHETAEATSVDPDTDALPSVKVEPHIQEPPAVSPSPPLPGKFPRARRPDPDHGGAGENPDDPRLHRGPFDYQGPPRPGRPPVILGASG